MRCLVVPVGASLLSVVAALLPAGGELAAQTPTATAAMEVTVGEGRLSVNVRDIPLADVLRVIGQEAGLKVHLDGHFRTPITTTFSSLLLESGIRRLIRGHSSSFAYDPPSEPGRTGRLTEIWIIESSATVRSAAPADPRTRAVRLAHVGSLSQRPDDGAMAELTSILAQDPDPVVRSRAALAVSRRGDSRATPALIAALADPHPSVRIQAVHGLRRVQGEQAAEALGRVLLSDADPSVRRLTVSVLASLRNAAAGSALGTAMSADSDASVRQAATAAYRRWERLAQPPPSR